MDVTSYDPLEAPADAVHQRFVVPVAYPVVFTRDVFAVHNRALLWALCRVEPDRRHRALVIVDDGVVRGQPGLLAAIDGYARAHARRLEWVTAPLVVAGGEGAKRDPSLLATLQQQMHNHGLDRHSYVIAIGGGALLDVVGFAAATVHRGVRLVRVPSTVLAQNDAGVGVKNGVNAFGVKNLLGTFAPPWAVLDDFALLTSLAPRDRIAGLAEAVKVGLVRDAEFFAWLHRHAEALVRGDRSTTELAIRRCAELHLEHIAAGGDPFESGSARPLDFGHWAAHKLENLTDHALRHGEAVAIGMALDTRISVTTGHLSATDGEAVLTLLGALGLPTWHEALASVEAGGRSAILAGLDEFREHLGGQLSVTLLAQIGRGVEVHAMAEADVAEAVAYLANRGQ